MSISRHPTDAVSPMRFWVLIYVTALAGACEHHAPATATAPATAPTVSRAATVPSEAGKFFHDPKVAALAYSLEHNDWASAENALRDGADLNAVGEEDMTIHMWTMYTKNKQAFAWLFDHGANPNFDPGPSNCALIWAAQADDPEWLRILLAHKANPSLIHKGTVSTETPLTATIIMHRMDNLKMLIAAGADVNYQQPKEDGAGTAAIDADGWFEGLYVLLEAGADFRLRTTGGDDVTYEVAGRNSRGDLADPYRAKVLEFLRAHGADVDGAMKKVSDQEAQDRKDYPWRYTIDDFTKSIERDPKDASAYKNRGDAKRAKGDFDGAIADLTQAIELNPLYLDAFINRGEAEHAKADYDRAIADITKVIELDPKSSLAYFKRGLSKGYKADNDGSIADMTKAIELNPQYTAAYINRGATKYVMGDQDAAIADYTKALELDPKSALAYLDRGLARQAKGDNESAIADFTQAIELDPNQATAYFRRGSSRGNSGDNAGALADFTKAIEHNPLHPPYYIYRGIAKNAAGDHSGAIADYTTATQLDPKNATAYFDRGVVEHDTGDYETAIADFTKTIALAPKYAAAYQYRGRSKGSKGDYDDAIADFTKAIELDPKNILAYLSRGFAKSANGDSGGAIGDCTKAIEVDSKVGTSYLLRGCVYYNLQAWKDALSDFQKSLELDPSLDYARIRVWLVRARLGEKDAATKELKEGLATRQAKIDDWVAHIIGYLAGQLPEADFLQAARSTDKNKDREHHCDAYFYMGAKRLIDNDVAGAADYFAKCVATGSLDSFEYQTAVSELKIIKPAGK